MASDDLHFNIPKDYAGARICQKQMCSDNIYSKRDHLLAMAKMNNDQDNQTYKNHVQCKTSMAETGTPYLTKDECNASSRSSSISPQTRQFRDHFNEFMRQRRQSRKREPKPCTNGKVRNPATGRCITPKKEPRQTQGTRRQTPPRRQSPPSARRRQSPPAGTRKQKQPCPDGFEPSEKTGRCVKMCPAGSYRNPDTGRCRKQ